MIGTQTLTDASKLMEDTLLFDLVDIYQVGEPVTEGYQVVRPATLFMPDVASLVQSTVLANAVESQVSNAYSVKVPLSTDLLPGMVVLVKQCSREPSLVGKHLLIDKVSENGMALIRKAVASDFNTVDQQGKVDIQWP